MKSSKEFDENRINIRKLKNKHLGQDCFIIGNGPSLKNVDLNIFNDYYTFATNKIYLIFDKIEWRPTYYIAYDHLVVKQGVSDIDKITTSSFIGTTKSVKKFFYKEVYPKLSKRENRYIFHVNDTISFGGFDISEEMGLGTVTNAALQIAYYMGFKRVFLVGVDHNYTYKGTQTIPELMIGNDPNHFLPSYFKDEIWLPPDKKQTEAALTLTKYYYEASNRSIKNATENSKLEIFHKISLDEAFNECLKKNTPNLDINFTGEIIR
ncbi:MAG: 6-hydroxymethylpterin diphosphokinase MptE-like protein [Chloroherpetonaceae bacterium]|nr:6-hydroxymethylpterin diphosphokinase MptE-like protein [Chloroherpetonaceae bacterium]